MGAVPRQRLGSGLQDGAGVRIARGGRGEHLDGQRGNLALRGALDPVNKIIRLVQEQRPEQALAQQRPFAVPVEGVNDGFDGVERDFVAAAPVAQNMAPAAEAERHAARRAAKAT